MRAIVPGLFMFTGLPVGRVYLVVDGDELTLIDTSIAAAGKRILAQLQTAGYALNQVRHILVTHAHPDHVGSLPALRQATGAQVLASARERPVIEGIEPIATPPREDLRGLARLVRPAPMRLPATPVDRVIGEGDLLPVFGGLQVLATPGHAPGHLAFWQPERRVLFCGDTIFRLPNLRLPFSFFTADMAANRRSIARLATLAPDVICFGHGSPLLRNSAARLRDFARRVAP